MVNDSQRYLYRNLVEIPYSISADRNVNLYQSPIGDIRVPVTITLNDNDYVRLLSAALNGAISTYPDDWVNVIAPLLTVSESVSMSCVDVANCIDDSTSPAYSAVINLSRGNEIASDYDIPPPANAPLTDYIPASENTQPLAQLPQPCDKDVLFGAIRNMVNYISDNGLTFLQTLVNTQDNFERVKNLVDLVPILGDTLADIANFITEIDEDLLNSYAAFQSQLNLDSVTCDIFTQVCFDCRYPTFDEVLNYFASRAVGNMPTAFVLARAVDLTAALGSIVRGVATLSPSTVWYSVNALQLFSFTFNKHFVGGFGRETLGIWLRLGEDEPSNDWTILCPTCVQVWEHTFDFTVDDGGFIPTSFGATYVSGKGWIGVDAIGGKVVNIIRSGFTATQWLDFRVTYQSDSPAPPNLNGSETTTCGTTSFGAGSVTEYVQVVEYNTPCSPTSIRVGAANGGGATNVFVSRIVIRGEGTNPFI